MVFLHSSRKVCTFAADSVRESGESPEQSRCCNLHYSVFSISTDILHIADIGKENAEEKVRRPAG